MIRPNALALVAVLLFAAFATFSFGQDPQLPARPQVAAKENNSGQGATSRVPGATQPGAEPEARDRHDAFQPKALEDPFSRGAQAVNEDKRDTSSGEPAEMSRPTLGRTSGEEKGPRRSFALCIGINDYLPESGFSKLQYAAADAIAMAKAFVTQAKFDNVLLMTDGPVDAALQSQQYKASLSIVGDVKRASLYEQIRKFFMRAKRRDDVLVFYFAGHGHSTTQAFLVPGDFNKDDPDPLSLSELFNLINGDRVFANNKLMILDACRSAVNDSSGRVMVRSFRDAMIQPDKQLAILTGCNSDQSSHEDSTLQHGRFTWALLDALGGNGFRAGQEYLFASHIFEHVEKRFAEREWGAAQAPQQFTSGSSITVAFRPVPKPAPLGQFEWDFLRRDHEEAKRRYRAGELEHASQAYRYALRATSDNEVLKNLDARQIHGQLLLERSVVLYRLGRKDEAHDHRTEAIKFRSESPALLELDAYALADSEKTEAALEELQAAVERSGDPTQINDYLWSRKATLEAALGQYAAATVSYKQAAIAAHRTGNKRLASQYFDEMRRIDFQSAWLDQSRLTKRPEFGIEAATATYECACEIFGPEHYQSTQARVLLDAITRQSKLTWPALQAIMEIETVFNRLDAQNRDADVVSVISLLNSIEADIHGAATPWSANSYSILGRRLSKLNRFAEAADALRAALVGYSTHYGGEHPNTIRTQIRLATALKSAGQVVEAERLMKDAEPGLAHLVDVLGNDLSADTTWDLGQMLYYAGNYQQAIPFLEAAASAYDTMQKPVDAAWMRGWLGDCYRELKDDGSAAREYGVAVTRFREQKHHRGIGVEGGKLAKALFRLRRYQEAIAEFESSAVAHAANSDVADAAWMQDWIGDSLRKLGRSRDAVSHYERALAAFQELGQKDNVAEVIYERADAHYEAGEYELASTLFENAIEASELASLPLKAAWAQAMQGLCQKKLNRDEQALVGYRGSLERFAKVEHKEDLAALHLQIAQMLRRLKRDEESLAYFERAAQDHTARGMRSEAAFTHVQRGNALQALQRQQQATLAYEEAVAVLKPSNSLDAMGHSMMGQAFHALARYDDALVAFTTAVGAYEKLGQAVSAAKMYESRGDCFRDLKRYDEAVAAYGESARRFDQMTHQEDLTYLRKELAKSLYRAKRYAEAIPKFEVAVQTYEKHNSPIDAAWMFAWIGDCHTALKRDEDAVKNYEECLIRFSRLDHNADMTHVFRDLGDALRRLNRYQEAIPHFESAVSRYVKLDRPIDAAWMHDRIAGCYRDLKQHTQAAAIYQATLNTFIKLEHKPGIAEESSDLGQSFFHLGRFREAAPFFQAAAKAYEELEQPDWAAYQQGWLGDCHRRNGDDLAAATAYRECVERFTSLKHDQGLALNAGNLAGALASLNRLDEALPHYRTSGAAYLRLKRFEQAVSPLTAAVAGYEQLKQGDDAAECRISLGLAYRETNRWDLSLAHHDLAITHFMKQGEPRKAAEIAEQLGQALLQTGRKDDARRYLSEAEQTYRKLNDNDKADQIKRTIGDLPAP